jgi:hypothetical protein
MADRIDDHITFNLTTDNSMIAPRLSIHETVGPPHQYRFLHRCGAGKMASLRPLPSLKVSKATLVTRSRRCHRPAHRCTDPIGYIWARTSPILIGAIAKV